VAQVLPIQVFSKKSSKTHEKPPGDTFATKYPDFKKKPRALSKWFLKTHDTTLFMKSMKQAEHVVLRARYSVLRLKKNKSLISGLLFEGAEKFQVKIYNNSLNSNHIHLIVKAPSQKKLHDFLRFLAGQIAQRITGAVRGKKNYFNFWLKPVWRRIVHWGRDFLNLHRYIYQNQLETLGLIAYQLRDRKPTPSR
jgi:REP element-mobilizing transposase RayT